MADTRQTDEHAHETEPTGTTLKRRGLIAGAATLVAAALTARTAQSVGATHQPEDVGLNISNSASATTGISGSFAGAVLSATNNLASTSAYALQGSAPSGYGVIASSTSGIGVQGTSASGYGVFGQANNYHSIFGQAVGAGYAGIYGYGYGANTYGILGAAGGTGSYAGVFNGQTSVNGTLGVISSTTHSAWCYGNVANGAGLLGIANVANSIGVYGTGTPAGSYAGYFSGRVVVSGDFAVTGSKSAALKHPDGSHRLVYCVEAPESWLEDFGTGTLSGGTATVALDPDFAALVDPTGYHVFLTEYDDNQALFVTQRTPTGFVVSAKGAPGASGTFSYRVVARRKDAAKNGRLAKVAVPDPSQLLPVPPPPKHDIKGGTPPPPASMPTPRTP